MRLFSLDCLLFYYSPKILIRECCIVAWQMPLHSLLSSLAVIGVSEAAVSVKSFCTQGEQVRELTSIMHTPTPLNLWDTDDEILQVHTMNHSHAHKNLLNLCLFIYFINMSAKLHSASLFHGKSSLCVFFQLIIALLPTEHVQIL